MFIKQLSIFLENRSGRLADTTELLAEKNIDIRALSIADTTDYGILRLIVDHPEEAQRALREEGMTVSITHVIAVALRDSPGGLHEAVRALADEGMSVEYMYAFISPRQGVAYVILRVEDNEKAVSILQKNNIELIGPEEIYQLL